MAQANAFSPVGTTVNVAVTGSNQYLAMTSLGGMGGTVRLANVGNQTVFILFGTGVVASTTTTGHPILPNTVETFDMGAATHIAVIAGTTGSTLYATSGQGA